MSATLRLDHVVIRVYNLAAAIAEYTARGFNVVSGGEHPGFGSRNALIAFEDDTYLELWAKGDLPPEQVIPRHVRFAELAGQPPLERHWLPWVTAPEGLVDFALVPSNIEEAIEAARARGLALDGPLPGSRVRPDGQKVAWQLAFAETVDLPFLCADVTPRSLRVPGGDARKHPNGETGIARVVIDVRELQASVRRYCALLGKDASVQKPEFTLGATTIVLRQGDDDDGVVILEFNRRRI